MLEIVKLRGINTSQLNLLDPNTQSILAYFRFRGGYAYSELVTCIKELQALDFNAIPIMDNELGYYFTLRTSVGSTTTNPVKSYELVRKRLEALGKSIHEVIGLPPKLTVVNYLNLLKINMDTYDAQLLLYACNPKFR